MTDTLVLYQPLGRQWGMPNLSPFCTKLETYLRLARWPYERRAASFRNAPKGKIPYIGLEGRLVGDSQLIMEMLESRRAPDARLDGWLSDTQRATGHALQRMLDEGLYFVLVHLRWVDEQGWAAYQPKLALDIGAARYILPLVRRGVIKANRTQGTGRHQGAQIAQMGIADLAALAQLIGEQRWIFGERPSTYDVSAFALVEGLAGFPVASAVRDYLLAEPRLAAYRARVRGAIWRDLPSGPDTQSQVA